MKIILIRHGHYPGNEKNIDYELNNLHDLHELGLSRKGIEEIKQTSNQIKDIIDGKKIKIISSDIVRAKETAAILSYILGYKDKIQYECDLQEYRFDYSKPFNASRYIDIVVSRYKEYNCENPAKLFFRVYKCIRRHILAINADYLIVSTHGGVIMSILGILCNKGMLSISVYNGAYVILDESFFI